MKKKSNPRDRVDDSRTLNDRNGKDLLLSRDFLEKIMEYSPISMWVSDADGTLLRSNRALRETLNVTEEMIVGRYNVFHDQNLIDQGVMPQVEAVCKQGIPCRFGIPWQGRKGGERDFSAVKDFFIDVSMFPIKDDQGKVVNVICQWVDVTERRRAEEALRKNEELMHLFVERAPVALAMFDRDMRYLAVSRRWMTDYQLADRDILGRSHYEIFPELTESLKQIHQRGLAGEVVHGEEDPFPRADGTVQWLRWEMLPWRQPNGEVGGIVIFTEDVTKRKRVEEALKKNQSQLAGAAEIAHFGPWEYDVINDLFTFNDHFYKIFRTTAEKVGGYTMSSADYARRFVHPEDVRQVDEEVRKAVEANDPSFYRQLDHRMVYEDGSVGYMTVRFFIVKDEQGQTVRTYGVNQDITDRVHAEGALKDSEERYRNLFMNAALGIYRTAPDGRILMANPSLVRMLGYSTFDELAERNLEIEGYAPDYQRKTFTEQIEQSGEIRGMEARWMRRDGSIIFVRENAKAVRGSDGQVLYYEGTVEDITKRRKAEVALRESEERFRISFENASIGKSLTGPDGRLMKVNQALCDYLGYTQKELETKAISDVTYPDDLAESLERVRRLLDGEQSVCRLEKRYVRKDGRVVWADVNTVLARDKAGAPLFLITHINDITERKHAEEALRESQARFQGLFEASQDGIALADASTGILVECNPALLKMVGRTREEVVGKHQSILHPPPAAETINPFNLHRDDSPNFPLTSQLLRKTGELIDVEITSGKVMLEGRRLLVGIFRDVTERKTVEKEKQKLEEQLLQAQKLETVGRLAGGVAHDFNNILQGILGLGEILQSKIDSENPLANYVNEIVKSAEAAAALTRQLLAFSRRQIIEPRVIDINGVIERSKKMIARLIGEDIKLEFMPELKLWRTRADPVQIDQILLNLAVNARDAMPEGGRLSIETANFIFDKEYCKIHLGAAPGKYVLLAVSDTGYGMTKDVLDKVFDPFFTTKEKGKGTGLGLSMVYGIVKQHGGFIFVYSEPGLGTTFKIYFPSSDDKAEEPVETAPLTTLNGTETVLLAEDQATVRRMTKQVLEENGYRVLDAKNGEEAQRTSDSFEGTIHLLLTDMVMPGMSGKNLSIALVGKRPEMKTLYMSGYTENAIVHRGALDPGTHFIEKPFKTAELLQKVREVLDAAADEKPETGTVLLIDDEESIRIVISQILEAERFEVLSAATAGEGLGLLRNRSAKIDLVLLDLTLPDMNGENAFFKIRELYGDVPVILVSGYRFEDIPATLRSDAKVSFLQKPFVRAGLLAAVKKSINISM